MSAAGVRRLIGTAAWLALGSAVAWAYAPSLGQMPRSDHWWYLLDTYGHDDFGDLVAHTYSWNRTRRDLLAGDTALFRPVLFTVLAAEKAWLDPRQELVQAVGVVLHLGICGLLYAVLRQLHRLFGSPAGGTDENGAQGARGTDDARAEGSPLPSPAAVLSFALTVFFALSPSVLMQVTWAHIHGYLVFDALLLGTLLLVLRGDTLPEASTTGQGRGLRSPTTWAWGLAFVAAFTYEMGQFAAVLFGLHLLVERWSRGERRAGLRALGAFAAIAVTYQVANRLDLARHLAAGHCRAPGSLLSTVGDLGGIAFHGLQYLVYTVIQPGIPWAFEATHNPAGVVDVPRFAWDDLTDAARRSGVRTAGLASLAVVGAALAWPALRAVRRWDATRYATVGLCVALWMLYAAIIVAGRWNARPEYVVSHSYVAYLSLLLFVIAVQAAATGSLRADRRRNRVRWALSAGLLLLAASGVPALRQANGAWEAPLGWWARQTQALRNFVDAHAMEPGFVFEVDAARSEPVIVEQGYETHALLFSKWTARATPGTARHVVVFRGDGIVVFDRTAP